MQTQPRTRTDRLRAPRALLALLACGPLALAACGSDGGGSADPGPDIRLSLVELGLIHHPEPLAEGGFPDLGAAGAARVFENGLGQTVRLDAAEISVQSFELSHCPESVERVTNDHAGDGESVTLLFEATDDIVAVGDLIAQTKTYEIGAHLYCATRVALGPTTLFGDGRPTFRFAGTCADATGTRAFDIESRGVIEKDLTIVNRNAAGEVVPTPLDPTAEDFARSEDENDGVQDLIFGTAYPALIDGIDCVAATDAELIAHVTGRLAGNALHQHTGTIRGFQGF